MITSATLPSHSIANELISLEITAARYLRNGPIIAIDCNDHATLHYLCERGRWPIFFESRASVAHTYRTRGFTIYPSRPTGSLSENSRVAGILLGTGVMEQEVSEIIELIEIITHWLCDDGLVVFSLKTHAKQKSATLLTYLNEHLKQSYYIDEIPYREQESIVLIRRQFKRPVHVCWQGSQDADLDGSLALVNKELCDRLFGSDASMHITGSAQTCKFSYDQQQARYSELTLPPDILIHHNWPPNFRDSQSKYTIHMQPWEFGALPQQWKDGLKYIDEIWSYTKYVATVYAEAGFPHEKIRIMPLGFDQNIYYPITESTESPEEDCIFSIVGGLIRRKGADLAIQAFCRAFSIRDRVCLLIKSSGSASYYSQREVQDILAPLHESPNAPRYRMIKSHMSATDIAALYRRSAALLCTFRGEGFGLPALEAMACGTPVIFSQGGAMDDFIPSHLGYPVLTKRHPIHKMSVEGWPMIHDGWFLQPDIDSIVHQLRTIYTERENARERGRQAAQATHASWTWDHSALHIKRRLKEISTFLGKT